MCVYAAFEVRRFPEFPRSHSQPWTRGGRATSNWHLLKRDVAQTLSRHRL